jgi:3-oxoacyl-[acyl-carrier protein] reductase
VTGGSRGIGAAIVRRLARDGADVAFTYVSKPTQADETAKAAAALGVRAIAIQADSADADAVAAAVQRTVTELGGIDILVNNAGVAVMAPVDDFRLAEFDRTVAGLTQACNGCHQATNFGFNVMTTPTGNAFLNQDFAPLAAGR